MQALSVPTILCLFAIAYGLPGTQIIGGKDAPAGMFPYQVSLNDSDGHFCGGSIISSRLILTAAHCLDDYNSTSHIIVQAGTNLMSSKGEVYEVDKFVMHADYNTKYATNDVGLVVVNRDIAFSDLVQPIPIATGNNTYEGSDCILTGWGSTRFAGPDPDHLQYIHLTIQSEKKCKEAHNNVIFSHICTFTKYGEGACNGDSGGPLVVNGVQVGIVSFGMPCGVGYPDVYSRVSYFAPWIKKQQTFLESPETATKPTDAIYIA